MPVYPEVERAPKRLGLAVAVLLLAGSTATWLETGDQSASSARAETSANAQDSENTSMLAQQVGSLSLNRNFPEEASRSDGRSLLSTEQTTTTSTVATTATSLTTAPTSVPVPSAPPITGDKAALMTEAGIPEVNFDEVDAIFTPESGWQPDNVSHNGCIGLGQNCPCHGPKCPYEGYLWLEEACPDWRTNVLCQIKRFHEYALDRYEGWEKALEFRRTYGYW